MIEKSKVKSQKSKAGFTLIELLVVISIIGILTALSLFGLKGVRESSRDSRRKADLETIRGGLEIYKSDCNGYPKSVPVIRFQLPASTYLGGTGSANCPVTNIYISAVPTDPLSTQNYYYKSSTGLTYILCAALENTPNPPGDFSGCGVNCGTGVTCNYKVANP